MPDDPPFEPGPVREPIEADHMPAPGDVEGILAYLLAAGADTDG